MRRLMIGLALAAMALPAGALGGGWATAGLAPPDDGVGPGETWNAQITILQHGQTPLAGVSPTVTIRNGSTAKTFKATPAGEPGEYVAKVVFPSGGTWTYEVYDGFTQYGGAKTHTFPAITIGTGTGGDGFPVFTATAVIGLVLALGLLGYVLARRFRPRAAAPTA
ncbi:MAG TPA: hypothetical protein VNB86_06185 [Gaiellaceae bacterium]|nr:hypothetical protein [Gaiellaceae bacterium]